VQRKSLSLIEKAIVLLPLALGPAMVLTDARTAFTWFFVMPCLLAIVTGLAPTGGWERVKWSYRPQYKFDFYFGMISATAVLSAIPGGLLWLILKKMGER
jgi:hypothetical protein